VIIQVAAAVVVVFTLAALAGTVAARQIAERESVNDALRATNLLADSVLTPALDDALLSPSASAAATAVARLDAVVRAYVLNASVVRVKLWDPAGRIIYSDEPRLIGQTFPLGDEERAVLGSPATRGEVSDLSRPENRYERGEHKLLEVYRPTWTPSRHILLFETYTRYDVVTVRSGQVWRGFAGVTVGSLVLMLVLQTPVTWALVVRLRRAQRQREVLLERAVSASEIERRRIAATIHDGVVQELAATSFVITGAAEQARTLDNIALVDQLQDAASAVRGSMGELRSLLVGIYPPSLRAAGLPAALTDLTATLRSRGIHTTLDLRPVPRLDDRQEALVFAVAQEILRNVARHSAAANVTVSLDHDDRVVRLEIADDGVGFDPDTPAEGHFGICLMTDRAAEAGAYLALCTAAGAGARWRLEIPHP
jgi:signal transduction histidine kinase